MSNDQPKSGDDFDLDWDSALGEWEADLKKEGAAKAVSEPLPQRPVGAPPPAAPSRPLYRPPSAEEVPPARPLPARPAPTAAGPARPPTTAGGAQPPLRAPRPTPAPRSTLAQGGRRDSVPASDSLFDAADDDMPTRVPSGADFSEDDDASTRVAGLGDLAGLGGPGAGAAGGSAAGAAAALEDDIDAMLDGLEAKGPVEQPKPVVIKARAPVPETDLLPGSTPGGASRASERAPGAVKPPAAAASSRASLGAPLGAPLGPPPRAAAAGVPAAPVGPAGAPKPTPGAAALPPRPGVGGLARPVLPARPAGSAGAAGSVARAPAVTPAASPAPASPPRPAAGFVPPKPAAVTAPAGAAGAKPFSVPRPGTPAGGAPAAATGPSRPGAASDPGAPGAAGARTASPAGAAAAGGARPGPLGGTAGVPRSPATRLGLGPPAALPVASPEPPASTEPAREDPEEAAFDALIVAQSRAAANAGSGAATPVRGIPVPGLARDRDIGHDEVTPSPAAPPVDAGTLDAALRGAADRPGDTQAAAPPSHRAEAGPRGAVSVEDELAALDAALAAGVGEDDAEAAFFARAPASGVAVKPPGARPATEGAFFGDDALDGGPATPSGAASDDWDDEGLATSVAASPLDALEESRAAQGTAPGAPAGAASDGRDGDSLVMAVESVVDDAEVSGVATDDDAEATISTVEGDDAERDLSAADELGDLEDVAPQGAPAPGAGALAASRTPPRSEAPRADRGAATALRTVRSRKPRTEHFALVGRSPDAARARGALLLDLAGRAHGPARARLLAAAAELAEALGDDASDLWTQVREADPTDLAALRALRRAAAQRGDWPEVAALLESELALPLEAEERGLTSAWLAEVRLVALGDPRGARDAALAACEARPRSAVAALLLAEACFAAEEIEAGYAALERAARAWTDERGRAALLVEVARAAERRGDPRAAADLYARAASADPTAFDAAFGGARAARAGGDVDAAVRGALAAAEVSGDAGVAEALRRVAARLVDLEAGRPAEAVVLLAGSRAVASLRARADAALRAQDRAARLGALEAWASAAGGTERALALLELAEARAEADDLEGADAALRAAALADASLGAVRVMREILARRAGDPSRLAHVLESGDDARGGALGAAAKLAQDPGALADERALAARAERDGEEPLVADALALDAAAEAADVEAVRAALRRVADRETPERRLGPLLALADLAMAGGDAGTAEAVLREARDCVPGEPTVLRPLAELVAPTGPIDAAELWLEEAAAAPPARAAHAATTAARILSHAGGDAPSALRRALEARPEHLPAMLGLEHVARLRADADALLEAHERLAEVTPDPAERAGRLVRAALLRGAADPAGASAQLGRARELAPTDAVTRDLLLRVGVDLPPVERAALVAAEGDGASPPFARAAALRSAAALEDAGEPVAAAEIYRRLLAAEPDALAELALDRVELAAGEVARVAERRFEALKAAGEEPHARVRALERLADLDLRERGDEASAVLSLQAILETSPGHVASLRTLERYYMAQQRDEELIGVEQRLVEHLSDPHDISAHLRLLSRLQLRPEAAGGDAADESLLGASASAELDLWTARHVEAAAAARGATAVQLRSARALVDALATPLERTAAALRVAEILERTGAVAEGAEALAAQAQQTPTHVAALEDLARMQRDVGEPARAAETYEAAAAASRVPARAVRFWRQAAVLWEDEADDPDRAVAALERAAALDLGHGDVYARLAALLERRGELARLAELTDKRLELGGDPKALVAMHEKTATVREQMGDRAGAREALRAALGLDPDRLEALRRLAELSITDEDWRGAAEALIRVARLTKDVDELKDVFFRLGDIYDAHLPDPRRAEAAFKRVLKLAPEDLHSLERLARLYEREGALPQAAETLGQLAQSEPDPERARAYRIELAGVLERQGQARQAESVLEQARRASPTDLALVRALAELYQRQNAQTALAMHLNRAAADLRHATEADPSDASAWHALVEVHRLRGKPDAARACASAAAALGIVDVELGRLLDAAGGIPGAAGAATDVELDDLLASPMLGPAARNVFRLAGDAIEKTVPAFEPKALGGQRVAVRDLPFRAQVEEIARWFGVADLEIWATASAPRICVPFASAPVALLVGRDVLASGFDAAERAYLLVRAVKIARSGLASVVRSQPPDVAIAIAGVMRHYDPNYAPPGLPPAAVDEAAKRFGKALPKKIRDELFPAVYEMLGVPGFDATRLGAAAAELGDRVALLATGNLPAAISALLRLTGADVPLTDPRRIEAVQRVSAARALLAFAVSDAHFDARHRVGVDRR